jgi:hypothetical protein
MNGKKFRGIPIIGKKLFDDSVELQVCGQWVHPPAFYDQFYVMLLALAVGSDPNVVKVLAAFSADFVVFASPQNEYNTGTQIVMRPQVDGSVEVVIPIGAKKKDTTGLA